MKRPQIHIENYEEYVIDFIENSLTTELNDAMVSFLNLHPNIAEEVMSFRNIQMIPDQSVIYPEVESLMKKPRSTFFFLKRFLVAATVLALIGVGLYTISNTSNDIVTDEILVEDESTTIKESIPQVSTADAEPIETVKEESIHKSNAVTVAKEEKVRLTSNALQITKQQEVKQVDTEETPQQTEPKVIQQIDIENIGPQRPKPIQPELLAAIEEIPTLIAPLEEKETEVELVFTITDPAYNNRQMLRQSRITGTLAFANTTVALLPTFLNKNSKIINSKK